MSFDGSVVACLTNEFNNELLGGKIAKIAQPEKNELLLTIKKDGNMKRLLISADASLPIIYITDKNQIAPLSAPSFCMLLRKYIQNGQIVSISQPSFERIINFEIEHYNEMGDLCRKILTVELMGKHSNIIFREGNKILDSIKHISALVSSVREVLPGREYYIPFEQDKNNPLQTDKTVFFNILSGSNSISKALYMNYSGFGPQITQEIIFRADLDADRPASSLSEIEKNRLFNSYSEVIDIINNNRFSPCIISEEHVPREYTAFDYFIYKGLDYEKLDSMSELLIRYYEKKQEYTNIRQKTASLRQIAQGLLSKDNKKYDLQLKQIKDTEKKEKYQLYGELITAYGYNVPLGSTNMTAVDYHTDKEITIPLDPTLSAIDNGKKYFEKYSKLKRTYEALITIVEQTKEEIIHLESILASLETAKDEADIDEIKSEMTESGYIKKNPDKKAKKKAIKSKYLHYKSTDGFDIYVGKNNYQNELITFKLADGNDWWFHAKNLPGSHVIVKTNGAELPDSTFEEAARLAAHYSKAEGAPKVEIDYIQRRFLKKPNGAKPGFVIYHTNYSMSAKTDISDIQEI